MKTLFINIIICFFPLIGVASTIISPESQLVGKYRNMVKEYQKLHDGELPTQWSDLESLDVMTQLAILGGPYQDRENLTDSYVILPPKDRIQFSEGELLLIRKEPVNLSKWIADFKKQRPNLFESPEEDEELNDWVRWAVYRNPKGDIRTLRLSEEKVQTLINEGLSIPEPEPYRFDESQVGMGAPGKTIDRTKEPDVSPIDATKSKDFFENISTNEQPKQETEPVATWWLWMLGVLVLLGVLAWLFSRRRR